MGMNSEKVYAFFNNCHEGKAAKNAQTLKHKLECSPILSGSITSVRQFGKNNAICK